MERPPFEIEPAGDGGAVLTVHPDDDPEPVRLTLDAGKARALRDGLEAAVERGVAGGQGAVAELEVDGATLIIAAVPGGSVRLRVER
jgi:hypothetical protein